MHYDDELQRIIQNLIRITSEFNPFTDDHKLDRIEMMLDRLADFQRAWEEQQKPPDPDAIDLERVNQSAMHYLMQDMAKELFKELKAQRHRMKVADDFGWDDAAVGWDDPDPVPEVLARTDGSLAFYRGRRNMVPGASESGKTWLMMLGIAQEIRAGRPVVLFDAENGVEEVRGRLRALGLTAPEVSKFLRYKNIAVTLPPVFAEELAATVAAEGGRLVIFDALTEYAASMGLDLSGGNANAVEQVFAELMDPWTRQGFAAVVLENTPKSSLMEAAGSQHKRSGLGGSQVACVTGIQFSKTTGGYSDLYVKKDRSGGLDWQRVKRGTDSLRHWGRMHVVPRGDGSGLLDVRVDPPPTPEEQMLEDFATEVDREDATYVLAAAAIRRQGVTSVASMEKLAAWMGALVKEHPDTFTGAYSDRENVTVALFKPMNPPMAARHGLTLVKAGSEARPIYRVTVDG